MNWFLWYEYMDSYKCTDLSYEQIPHHLSGGVHNDLALNEFDSRLLQHQASEVTLFTPWSAGGKIKIGEVSSGTVLLKLFCHSDNKTKTSQQT